MLCLPKKACVRYYFGSQRFASIYSELFRLVVVEETRGVLPNDNFQRPHTAYGVRDVRLRCLSIQDR